MVCTLIVCIPSSGYSVQCLAVASRVSWSITAPTPVQQNVARESREDWAGGSDQPRAAECCNPTPSAPRPVACPRTHTLSAQPRAAEPKPCRASSIVHKLRECWIVTMRARPLRPASGSGPSAALPAQSTPVLAEANSYGGRRNQLIPPVLSLFTRFRPYLAHFSPVFSRFLRVFTVSTRRFQQAQSQNPGPRNSRHGHPNSRKHRFSGLDLCKRLCVTGHRRWPPPR